MHYSKTMSSHKTMFCLILLIGGSSCCFQRGMNRVQRMLHTVSSRMGLMDDDGNEGTARRGHLPQQFESNEVEKAFRVNVPGQRFTATHGIAMRKGMEKNLVFVVDRPDANYIAVSANIAVSGAMGAPDKYELFMSYGQPPTPYQYDQKSVVTASESYVGEALYSRDIVIQRPKPGPYHLLLVAHDDFHELLITAIMDTPPDAEKPSFTIQRMGELAVKR